MPITNFNNFASMVMVVILTAELKTTPLWLWLYLACMVMAVPRLYGHGCTSPVWSWLYLAYMVMVVPRLLCHGCNSNITIQSRP